MIFGFALDMSVSSRTYHLNLTIPTKVLNTIGLVGADIQSSSVSCGLIRIGERRNH